MIIRPAVVGDFESIKDLVFQLGYDLSSSETLKLYIKSENYGIFVAEIDGIVVGMIAYSITRIFVSGKTRVYVEGLVVDSKHRRQGIARKLLSHLENFAKSLAPAVVDLVSGVRRIPEGSHDFYKAMGYELKGNDRKIYFRKEMGLFKI